MVQYGAKQGKKIHHDTRQRAGFKYKIRYEINIYERKK